MIQDRCKRRLTLIKAGSFRSILNGVITHASVLIAVEDAPCSDVPQVPTGFPHVSPVSQHVSPQKSHRDYGAPAILHAFRFQTIPWHLVNCISGMNRASTGVDPGDMCLVLSYIFHPWHTGHKMRNQRGRSPGPRQEKTS